MRNTPGKPGALWWQQAAVQLTKMQQQETNNPRGKPAGAEGRLQNSLTPESNPLVGAADLPLSQRRP